MAPAAIGAPDSVLSTFRPGTIVSANAWSVPSGSSGPAPLWASDARGGHRGGDEPGQRQSPRPYQQLPPAQIHLDER